MLSLEQLEVAALLAELLDHQGRLLLGLLQMVLQEVHLSKKKII